MIEDPEKKEELIGIEDENNKYNLLIVILKNIKI